MIDERCERTDLITTQCAHCLGHVDPAADALANAEPHRYVADTENLPTVSARFATRCPNCDEPIHVGDAITNLGGPTAAYWVCAGCVP